MSSPASPTASSDEDTLEETNDDEIERERAKALFQPRLIARRPTQKDLFDKYMPQHRDNGEHQYLYGVRLDGLMSVGSDILRNEAIDFLKPDEPSEGFSGSPELHRRGSYGRATGQESLPSQMTIGPILGGHGKNASSPHNNRKQPKSKTYYKTLHDPVSLVEARSLLAEVGGPVPRPARQPPTPLYSPSHVRPSTAPSSPGVGISGLLNSPARVRPPSRSALPEDPIDLQLLQLKARGGDKEARRLLDEPNHELIALLKVKPTAEQEEIAKLLGGAKSSKASDGGKADAEDGEAVGALRGQKKRATPADLNNAAAKLLHDGLLLKLLQPNKELKGDNCTDSVEGKLRCALCEMYFKAESLGAVISRKAVMEVRGNWEKERVAEERRKIRAQKQAETKAAAEQVELQAPDSGDAVQGTAAKARLLMDKYKKLEAEDDLNAGRAAANPASPTNKKGGTADSATNLTGDGTNARPFVSVGGIAPSEYANRLYGAKGAPPSFMYAQVRLCVFCAQLFSSKSRASRKFNIKIPSRTSTGVLTGQDGSLDASIGHHKMIASSILLNSLKTLASTESQLTRNLAVGGTATMSSSVDGGLATLAISGVLRPQSAEHCAKSRREFEAWWEVELDTMSVGSKASFIKTVGVYNKVDYGEDAGASKEGDASVSTGDDASQVHGRGHHFHKGRTSRGNYTLAPFWIFITAKPLGTARLIEAKRKAIASCLVHCTDDVVKWHLPKNTQGCCVRIQVEGVKTLYLAQVEVVKGGLVSNEQEDVRGINTAGSGFVSVEHVAFDYIGDHTAARPSTAPSPSTPGGFSQPSASSPYGRPGNNGLSRTAASLHVAFPVSPQKSSSKLSQIGSEVEKLLDQTAKAYQDAAADRAKVFSTLNDFHPLEAEAVKRNFLAFATQPKGREVPIPWRGISTRDDHEVLNKCCEIATMTNEQLAEALLALKAAGLSGPRLRPEKTFGVWEKVPKEKAAHPGAYHEATEIYVSLVDSFCIEALPALLREVDIIRDNIMKSAQLRITWKEYVGLISCCMKNDLAPLIQLFKIPKIHAGRLVDAIEDELEEFVDQTSVSSLEAMAQIKHDIEGNRVSPTQTHQQLTQKPGAEREMTPTPGAQGETRSGSATMGRRASISLAQFVELQQKSTPPKPQRKSDSAKALSLSKSLATLGSPIATYANTPAVLKRVKAPVPGAKNTFQRSQESFEELKHRFQTEVIPHLTGFEYADELAKRRARMHELHAKAPKPEFDPAQNRKNCSLCTLTFPADSLMASCSVKCLKTLAKKWGSMYTKFGPAVTEGSLLMQHRIPLCVFCAQFFDPDSEDGLLYFESGPSVNYVPFFDDRHPDRYSHTKVPELQSDGAKGVLKRANTGLRNFMGKMEEESAVAGQYKDVFDRNDAIRKFAETANDTELSRSQKNIGFEKWQEGVNKQEEELETYDHSSGALLPDHDDAEDRKYLDKHKKDADKFQKKMRDRKLDEEKVLRGTVRGKDGRKVASTGLSIFEFTTSTEAQRARERTALDGVGEDGGSLDGGSLASGKNAASIAPSVESRGST